MPYWRLSTNWYKVSYLFTWPEQFTVTHRHFFFFESYIWYIHWTCVSFSHSRPQASQNMFEYVLITFKISFKYSQRKAVLHIHYRHSRVHFHCLPPWICQKIHNGFLLMSSKYPLGQWFCIMQGYVPDVTCTLNLNCGKMYIFLFVISSWAVDNFNGTSLNISNILTMKHTLHFFIFPFNKHVPGLN